MKKMRRVALAKRFIKVFGLVSLDDDVGKQASV
jgi:hypothetical protein